MSTAEAATTFTRLGCRVTRPRRCRPGHRRGCAPAADERRPPGPPRTGVVAVCIGVVPAWLHWPVMVSSCHEMPCTPVTAPMCRLRPRAPGPARCAARRRRGVPGSGTAAARRSRSASSSSPSSAPSMPGRSRAASMAMPPGAHQAAELVGREAGALLVGEEGDRQWPAAHAGLLERVDHLEPGQHAVVAVVAPAGRTVSMCEPVMTGRRRPRPTVRPRCRWRRRATDEVEVLHPGDDEVAPCRSSSVRARRQHPPSPVCPISPAPPAGRPGGLRSAAGAVAARATHGPERAPACTFRQGGGMAA